MEAIDAGIYGPQLGGLPNLNDSAQLEHLLRAYTQDLLGVRGAWAEGQVSGEDATRQVCQRARTYGRTLLGEDHRYYGGPWFTPGGLGQTLAGRLGVPADPEDVPYVLLLGYARGLFDLLDGGQVGTLPGFVVGHRLDAYLAQLRDALLGVDVAAVAELAAGEAAQVRAAVAAGQAARD
jgi:hypothetical protein